MQQEKNVGTLSWFLTKKILSPSSSPSYQKKTLPFYTTPHLFSVQPVPFLFLWVRPPRHLASCKTAHLAAPKPLGDELRHPPLRMSAWKIVSMVSEGVITPIYIPIKARLYNPQKHGGLLLGNDFGPCLNTVDFVKVHRDSFIKKE